MIQLFCWLFREQNCGILITRQNGNESQRDELIKCFANEINQKVIKLLCRFKLKKKRAHTSRAAITKNYLFVAQDKVESLFMNMSFARLFTLSCDIK